MVNSRKEKRECVKMFVCVCVCVCSNNAQRFRLKSHLNLDFD